MFNLVSMTCYWNTLHQVLS